MDGLDNLTDGLVQSVRAAVERALAPYQKRIAELETMQGDLLQRLDKHAVALESLEKRASRQGEHLANIESKLQRLRGGG
jgi:prefoldin subunit 5